jgi:hypothetical protein
MRQNGRNRAGGGRGNVQYPNEERLDSDFCEERLDSDVVLLEKVWIAHSDIHIPISIYGTARGDYGKT